MIEESKRSADKNFGRQLSEKYKEDKRLYWKEVKEERKGGVSVRIEGSGMKDANGRILKDKTAVNERWTECF